FAPVVVKTHKYIEHPPQRINPVTFVHTGTVTGCTERGSATAGAPGSTRLAGLLRGNRLCDGAFLTEGRCEDLLGVVKPALTGRGDGLVVALGGGRAVLQPDQDRGGEEDRGEGALDDTDELDECQILQGTHPHHPHRDNHQRDDRQGGDDRRGHRTHERLVDGQVGLFTVGPPQRVF